MKTVHLVITFALLLLAALSFFTMTRMVHDKSHLNDRFGSNQLIKQIPAVENNVLSRFRVSGGESPSNYNGREESLTEDILAQQVVEKPWEESFPAVDPVYESWRSKFKNKLQCSEQQKTLYYMYHIRKAAGTTIRDIVKASLLKRQLSYVETEGTLLQTAVLDQPYVFSITSLRDPINRILSLYWYEHVGWYHGTLRQTNRCRPLNDWVTAWKDHSPYKRKILHENPNNNYMEIENYYVKAFSNWQPSRRNDQGVEEKERVVDESDFLKAKETLLKFDLILISEWLGDETEIDALNAIFSGRSDLAAGVKLRGDKKAQANLKPTLAPDEDVVLERLRAMNTWDIKLYDFAKSLVAWRLKQVVPIIKDLRGHLNVHGVHANFRRRLTNSGAATHSISSRKVNDASASMARTDKPMFTRENNSSQVYAFTTSRRLREQTGASSSYLRDNTRRDVVDPYLCAGYAESIQAFPETYKDVIGIFRPSGHKGP